MKQKDLMAISAIGVLALSVITLLAGAGIDVPSAAAALLPIVYALVISGVRLYVWIVGADNTNVDEIADQVNDGIESLVAKVKKQ